MGLLKHFRSRSKLNEKNDASSSYHNGVNGYNVNTSPYQRAGADYISRLPDNVLKNIFTYVCPHVLDESYETSERSEVGDGCMLCDLRDLGNCARVRRNWYQPVQELLYKSIRIDAVHYCELEEILAEKRRRKSRHGDAPDAPATRLHLLSRSVWDNQWLASLVLSLKLPYMTRETCKADLARCVSALPNLQYVDLPDGFFTGDQSCHTLRNELQARCPEIRKMKYDAGSEQLFEMLLQGHWLNLSTVEVSRLRNQPQNLRRVLGFLPTLHELTLSEMPNLTDSIFHQSPSLQNFPPLQSLTIEQCPHITAQGLTTYLSDQLVKESLTTLSLSATGVTIPELHQVIWAASNLKALRVIEQVATSMPLDPIPPMASFSLSTLKFELTPRDEESSPRATNASALHLLASPMHASITDSYYAYLSSSLMSNSLPALRELYVRDPTFPDSLLLAPPVQPFAGGKAPPKGLGGPQGLTHPLSVYTKGLDEHDWVYNFISPTGLPAGRRGSLSLSGGRPMSAYSASRGLGPQWGTGRESVVVGNGFGGFLAIPSEEVPGARPGSRGSIKDSGAHGHRGSWMPMHAATEKRGSRGDLWR
ncbi:hypothetical protein NA57DRAFT_43484 [Rhizodiscina lignyota]|uniref:F-box domain-containing protein n=1 Tax=Rhizodiscina lignyota TaxID=1504668 RepID=A0A9P4IDF1_9PEZI|nr:hypothetical protein NA57DRAFT_43484 [Rhizodiscina lignyota]